MPTATSTCRSSGVGDAMPNMALIQGSLGFGQTFATSTYSTVLTSGAANVKGTAVELIAATDHDAHWVEVMATSPGVTARSYAVDLLIGSATEAVLIPNLTFMVRASASGDGGGRWLFPVFVPKGSRLAAQCADTGGAGTLDVAVALFNAGLAANGFGSTVTQYGTLSNSRGVNVDPGAVAHTDVTVQLTASTLRAHQWLVLTVLNTDTAFTATTKWLIDVCIGAATEEAILSDWPLGGSGTLDVPRPDQIIHIPAFVPQGSRLTVRARCSITTDTDRDLFVTIHGA